jgi:hypothetical protein
LKFLAKKEVSLRKGAAGQQMKRTGELLRSTLRDQPQKASKSLHQKNVIKLILMDP